MGAMFNTPAIRQMYLRRVRTLMDEQLQPPGTPPEQGHFEQRLYELVALMDPHDDPPGEGTDDADLDYIKWGSWTYNGVSSPGHTMRQDVDRILTEYLPVRRSL